MASVTCREHKSRLTLPLVANQLSEMETLLSLTTTNGLSTRLVGWLVGKGAAGQESTLKTEMSI